MASNQEIEVKLRIEPDTMPKIRRSDWWRRIGPGRRQSLHSVYFDTNDLQLRKSDLSLRTRTDGHEFVQTLKMLNGNSDSISRLEWEALVPDPVPDPSLVIDPALPDGFRRLSSVDLHPVFDIDIKRETRRLISEHAEIDVSLDSGAVIAGEQREPIHEVELELVAGEVTDLFARAQRISDAIEGRLHLRTKADLGYALRGTEHWTGSRASKLYLTPEMSSGDALRLITLNSLCHLTANDDCARLNLHIEGVHQCRVALRRLRSAFKIYKQSLRRKRIEPIEGAARWLATILGTARDLDVFQTELLDPAIHALGEAELFAPLVASLEVKKAEAYEQVSKALVSSRYRHFLIDLCALTYAQAFGKVREGACSLDQPLAEFASTALSTLYNKVVERGDGFETLSKPDRHEVRIALKRLRYAVDFFANAFDGQPRKKFIKRLARLQDGLGRMNDVAVAEKMLAQLTGIASNGSSSTPLIASDSQLSFAAGGILGWHRRRAAELDPHLVKDWNAFVRSKPFW
jgi:inorganic triphosphatase YgiF